MALLPTQTTPVQLSLVVVSLVVLIRFAVVINRAFFTPLRHVPGPFYARFTNLPLKLHVIQGRRLHYIHSMHLKYGPFVRISPTEIAVSDLVAFRTIHKIGTEFRKSPWYQKFNQSVAPGIFAMTDPKTHAERRRLFAQQFANSAILKYEASVKSKASLAISKIERDARAGNADLLKWWTSMATDVAGELSFGKSFGMLEQEDKTQYLRDLEATMMISGVNVELPWLLPLARLLPIKSVQTALNLTQRLDTYGETAIQNHKEYLASKPGTTTTSLFARFIDPTKQRRELSESEIVEEAKNLIVAGSDTTAVSLTYLVWAVLRPANRDVRMKLLEEISTLPADASAKEIGVLKFLRMVIEETLRLYGAAPGSLPRMVPSEGAVLGGYWLPGGTTVSTQAYTMHRDANIYEEPECFRPERWRNPTQEMNDAFSPFGAGSRTCIGIHLAMLELQVAAFTFFKRCPTAELASTTTDETMEMENYFLIAPKGHKCEVFIRSEKA